MTTLSLALACCLTAGTAAAGDGFTVAEVLGSPLPTSLTASDTGDSLAWVFNLDGVTNVWAARAPDFDARRLSSFDEDDGRPLEILGFSADGAAVYVAKRSRFNPDHRALGGGPSTLLRVRLDGGETEQLAEADWAAVSPTGLRPSDPRRVRPVLSCRSAMCCGRLETADVSSILIDLERYASVSGLSVFAGSTFRRTSPPPMGS